MEAKKNNSTKKQKRARNTSINLKKILLFILMLTILAYVLYAIYNLIKQPTDIVLVEQGKLYLEESVTGYLIRDEEVIQGENYKNGIVRIKEEGQKVSKGDSVFRYYTSGEEKLQQKIQELDIKIDEALAAENNSLFSSDIKVLEKEIEYKLEDIYNTNDMEKLLDFKKNIESAMTKKSKIAGELSPAGSYIRQLIDERSKYEKQLNSGSEDIKAPISGMVSYRVDGLEDVITTQDFSTLSKSVLEGLKLKTGQIIASSEEKGKIINNFECYITTVLESEKSKEVVVGDKLKLRLSNGTEINATIEYIAEELDGSKLFVFKIIDSVEELISYRKVSFDIIWWSYSGLKVPNSAIIKEADLSYVIRNKAGYLDKVVVNVKRSNENYSIVTNYTTTELKELGYDVSTINASRNISLYDEILLYPSVQYNDGT